MIRYAIFDKLSASYVGHRTSCYDYKAELPEWMITRNHPAVGPEKARLYTRKYDAQYLINHLNDILDDYNRFEIIEFVCNTTKNENETYYILN